MPAGVDRLQPCKSDAGPTDAYCGKVEVWEDREAKSGRKISLKVVVYPALRRDDQAAPLFYLAGGPGMGAAKSARPLREVMRSIQTDRDLVFVDQRGTGDSNLLSCKPAEDPKLEDDPDAVLPLLRKCLDSYSEKADVRFYTTPIAMDDLDEVREFLGYPQISIYGGSYGTRAAIVYARRHRDRVKAVVLDGVAPTDMRLGLFMPRDSQRALELLARDCEQDPACVKRFPGLAARLDKVLAALEAKRVLASMPHPRSGEVTEIPIRRGAIANALFSSLYDAGTASLIPLLIERAEKGDYSGILALTARFEGLADSMAPGMHYSVVCSEDAPRMSVDEIKKEAAGKFLGAESSLFRLKVCDFWPKGKVDASYYDGEAVDVPALILSGELDPVTPPSWGSQVAGQWKNSKHIVVPGVGHGTVGSGCVMRLMKQFLKESSAANLKTECVQVIKRSPFFLGPAGPDPMGAPQAGAKPGEQP
ncbi:MAG: alpha/beta hydrolase [Bryobacteraceae bacterium]